MPLDGALSQKHISDALRCVKQQLPAASVEKKITLEEAATFGDTNEPIGRLTADELKMAARAFLTSRTDKKALDTIDMLLRERR